jgi:hypothetical protein
MTLSIATGRDSRYTPTDHAYYGAMESLSPRQSSERQAIPPSLNARESGLFLDCIASITGRADVRERFDFLYAFDPVTADHCKRVYTEVMRHAFLNGFHNRFESQDLIDLGIGSLLHDIGKTEICETYEQSRTLVQLPRVYTTDEITVMRRHPELGRDLLKDFGPIVMACAERHHEYSIDPYPFEGNSPRYHPSSGLIAPVDNRPTHPAVPHMLPLLAAWDMRDGNSSIYDDRPARNYQAGDQRSPMDIAEHLIKMYRGPTRFMLQAVHSLVDAEHNKAPAPETT